MLDFSKLKLVKRSKDSFVGIRKSSTGEELEFYLPNGFEDFPSENFDEIKNLFFRMYRTFRKFERDNIGKRRLKVNETKFPRDRDLMIFSSSEGISLKLGESECILYSKIKMLEHILEAYDELAINSIQKKNRSSEEIDYSQIHRYLDRAIYLDNDVVYMDSMELPRPSVKYESTDLINLYCYILDEIVQQLDGDVAENIILRLQDIQFLAQHFRDDYLTINQSIFDRDTFHETIIVLKEALDSIDRNTYYKDSDYWQLYEAIEIFLYGEINFDQTDGDFWGISNFSMLWEDMCNVFFFNNYYDDILYADTDIPLKSKPNLGKDSAGQSRIGNYSTHSASNPYNQQIYRTISDVPYPNQKDSFWWNELLCIELDLKPGTFAYQNERYSNFSKRDRSTTEFRRFPNPDLIIKNGINNSEVKIIDYKNVSLSFYTHSNSSEKYIDDTTKQLTYELAVQQTHKVSGNWFFIPYFYVSDPNPFPLYELDLNLFCLGEIATEVKNLNGNTTGIKVFKANFLLIQKVYLDENS